ncbi:lasso RiPP family leader peptide-containing protein [Microbispora sp. ZYX-F-249]|uniref:Lasso RiPP family leader peptide-containing protein n=1 Tax=Microbispora maris TaxID=3144104 RepID=A0ABV0AIQ9_9ACTN
MNEQKAPYEAPAVAEVGDFSELTRDALRGKWIDSILGWYWL